MQACRRWVKRDGSVQILDVNLSKASFKLPVLQR